MGEQPPFSVSRTVRARGQKLRIFQNKNPGAQLRASEAQWSGTGGKEILLFMFMRRDKGLGKNQRNCPVYDLSIVDARGQTHALPAGGIVARMPNIDEDFYGKQNKKMPDHYFFRVAVLTMPAKSQLPLPLKVRGKISVNDAWPIPFEVKLPPRPTKPRTPATPPGR